MSKTENMQQWQSHKRVRAEQIIDIGVNARDEAVLTFLTHRITVEDAWMVRFVPRIGGYFVVYPDGYASYSPRAAFESGYTRVDPAGACNERNDHVD